MNKKAFVCLFLICFLVLSFSFSPVSATPPTEKFDVTFEIDVGLTHKKLYVEVHNLHDSGDNIDYGILINNTNYPILETTNLKYSIFKTNLVRPKVIDDYDFVSHSRVYDSLTLIDAFTLNGTDYIYLENQTGNSSQVEDIFLISSIDSWIASENIIYWFEYEYIGWYLGTELYDAYIEEAFVSRTEDGNKGELRHKFEQVAIQKNGQEKDTIKFLLEWDTPIIKTSTGWGNKGIAWLEMNGVTYVDMENSSWWNVSFDKKRVITVTNNNATDVLEKGYTITFEMDVSGSNNGTYAVVYQDTTEIDRINITQDLQTNTNISFATQYNQSGGQVDNVNYSVYYDNASTFTSMNNGSNVYLLYDECNDGTIDTDIWTTSGSVSESGGRCIVDGTGAGSWGTDYMLGKIIFPLSSMNKIRYTWRANIDTAESGFMGIHKATKGSVVENTLFTFFLVLAGGPDIHILEVGSDLGDSGQDWVVGTLYDWRVTSNSTNVLYEYKVVGTESWTEVRIRTFSTPVINTFAIDAEANDISLDFVMVQKHITPEPTTSLGVEEIGPSGINVTINSPTNTTFNLVNIDINVTLENVSEIDTVIAEINGTTNITLINSSGNWHNSTEIIFVEGQNNITILSNLTDGSRNDTEQVFFTIDRIFPIITIDVPTNTTDNNTVHELNASMSDLNPDSMNYSVDGNANITVSGNVINVTISTTSDGSHNVRVCGNDTANNINCSTVFFTVDVTGPDVDIINPGNSTFFASIVQLIANATDNHSNVSFMFFSVDDSSNSTPQSTNISTTLDPLSNGSHFVRVCGNDIFNNENCLTRFFSISVVNINFTSPTPNNGSSISAFSRFSVAIEITLPLISDSFNSVRLDVHQMSDDSFFAGWEMDYSNISSSRILANVELDLPTGNFKYRVRVLNGSNSVFVSDFRNILVSSSPITIDFVSPTPQSDGIIFRKRGFSVASSISQSNSIVFASLSIVTLDGSNIVGPFNMDIINNTDSDFLVVASVPSSITKTITDIDGFIFVTATDDLGNVRTSVMRHILFKDEDFDISCLLTSSGRDCESPFSFPGGKGYFDYTFGGVEGRFILSIIFIVFLLIGLQKVDAGNITSGIIIGSVAMMLSRNGWLPQWVWIVEVIMISGITMKTIFDIMNE